VHLARGTGGKLEALVVIQQLSFDIRSGEVLNMQNLIVEEHCTVSKYRTGMAQ
jgi:protein tyrosine/serine phosphatase